LGLQIVWNSERNLGSGSKVVKSNKFVHANFSAPNSLSMEIRIPLSLSVQESYPLHERLISCFLDTNGDQSVLFLHWLFPK